MKNKKYILTTVIILIILTSFIGIVKADSGWDYSYDSGSSWDSDFSWDSSWGSDSSWDYGSSSYYGSPSYTSNDSLGTIIIVIVTIIIIASIVSTISKSKRRSTSYNFSKSNNYLDLTSEKIKEIDNTIDKESLKKEVFTIYKTIQESWMNFDYITLRKYTTDELYNMYESQLKILKTKNQKNIMKDIALNNIKIINIDITNNVEKITIYLNVYQYDYVADNNNKVVRGDSKRKNNVEYIITLTRNITNEKIHNCPNCGASIDIVSGGTCPYCDSTIINKTDKFIMSKKECINQRKV